MYGCFVGFFSNFFFNEIMTFSSILILFLYIFQMRSFFSFKGFFNLKKTVVSFSF